jgi:hypothetical protein
MARQRSAGRTNALLGSALEAAASVKGLSSQDMRMETIGNPKGIETTTYYTDAYVYVDGSYHQHLSFILIQLLDDGLCMLFCVYCLTKAEFFTSFASRCWPGDFPFEVFLQLVKANESIL